MVTSCPPARVVEGETPDAPALGRADDLVGRSTSDGQDVAVQVRGLQGGELAAPGTGVRREARQQQNLLGSMQLEVRAAAGPVVEVVQGQHAQAGKVVRGGAQDVSDGRRRVRAGGSGR